jgi:hypothetical protein
MLLADGKIQFLGTPAEAGHEYLKLNFEAGAGEVDQGGGEADGVKLLTCRLEDERGEPAMTVDSADEIRLKLELELQRDADAIHVGFTFANADDLGVFEFGEMLTREAGYDLSAGKRVTVTATIENRFVDGRYFIHCGIHSPSGIALYVHKATTFVVFGGKDSRGVMSLDRRLDVQVEDAG